MKWLLVILLPLAVSAILTYILTGWKDSENAIETFVTCFIVLGGIETIVYASTRNFQDD
jgi:hypothetical protein